MQLCYYHAPEGNFGDDLNPWLWDRLLPGAFKGGADLLVGMGTLLDDWFTDALPPSGLRVVLGSGSGISRRRPLLGSDWKVYGVRGPLTAGYLGLDWSYATTDPAMTLRDLWPDDPPARSGVGFIPHHSSVGKWDWPKLCAEVGLIYIDPGAPPLEVVDRIGRLERVLTEAMHGAIIADALRTPWVALKINPFNYTGKWEDWGSSISTAVYFQILPDLYDPVRAGHAAGQLKALARTYLRGQRPTSGGWELDECRAKLMSYAREVEPQLSRETDLDRGLDRFYAALDRLRGDLQSGALDTPLSHALAGRG
jgi:succinoglycan biosynthesis protein ExoV